MSTDYLPNIMEQRQFDWAHGANLVALASLASLLLSKFGINLLPGEAETVITAVAVIVSLFINKKEKNLTIGGFKKL